MGLHGTPGQEHAPGDVRGRITPGHQGSDRDLGRRERLPAGGRARPAPAPDAAPDAMGAEPAVGAPVAASSRAASACSAVRSAPGMLSYSAWPHPTYHSGSPTSARASATRDDLPMPGSPSTQTTDPSPRRRASAPARRTASSCARPTQCVGRSMGHMAVPYVLPNRKGNVLTCRHCRAGRGAPGRAPARAAASVTGQVDACGQ
jgi:hypothetical protein